MTVSRFIFPLAAAALVVSCVSLAHAQSPASASGSGPASSGAPMNGSTNGTTNGSNNGNAAATTGNGISRQARTGGVDATRDRNDAMSSNTMGASPTAGVTNASGANNASSTSGARR